MRAKSIQIHTVIRPFIIAMAVFATLLMLRPADAMAQGFALSINGPREICVGETGVYTAVSDLGTGYSWTVARGTIVSGQNTNSISVEWAGGGMDTITVYAVSTAGVPETRTIAVSVVGIAKPIIRPSGSTTICKGGFVELWAPDGFNDYLWSNGHTSQFIRVTSGGTFSVTVFNSRGCSATSPPVKVTMLLAPEPVITPLGPTTFCEGDFVILDGGEGFVAYDWSNGDGTRFITARKSGLYQVTVRDIYGCTATSPPLAVNVIPAPAPPTITRQGSMLTSSPGLSYQWYRDGVEIQGATERSFEVKSSGRYAVRVTNEIGCSSVSVGYQVAYAGMTVTIPDMDVDLHRTLTVPLAITKSTNMETSPMLMYRAQVRFDRDALYPLDVPSTLDGNDRVVTLSGTWTRGDSILDSFQCTPMWSDITETTVIIDTCTFFTDDVYVETEDGTLRWLLCNEGGTRLFLNNKPMGLAQNHPNPFNASTSIEYTIIEEGPTILAVYNMLGREVATLVNASIPPGTYRVTFDASALPSGIYMYVLQTPTDRDMKLMELIK